MNDQDEECIGCARFSIIRPDCYQLLCAFKETMYSSRCPCRDCIVKSTCSIMCDSRVSLLDEILGNKKEYIS